MGELLGFLIVLVVILGLITVLGHGLWLAVTWIVRTLAGQQSEGVIRACPQCGCAYNSQNSACKACGWPVQLPAQRRQANLLRNVQRDLERFGQSGLIDAACLERLSATLQEEQARLRTPPANIVTAELVTAEPVHEAVPNRSALAEPAGAASTTPFAPPQPRPEPLDPAERARQYMARQAERTHVPGEPLVAPPPKRSRPWSEIFQGFLEEKNIRWGELVGGLLIVCCSIALVISFWSAIAERPFLKFFIFNGVTAGLFAVGFYTQHRLKLPHTSQGLLMIATLLAPLNFLAIAAFSRGPAPADVFTLAGELCSIGIFTALVYFAGRMLTSPWPAALVFGVMGSSISQLLVRRFVEPGGEPFWLYATGALPLACYVGSIAWAVVNWPGPRALEHARDRSTAAHASFRLLGLVAFAFLLPAGLLLAKSGQPISSLRLLAPLVSLAGVPLLTLGLYLMRRTDTAVLALLRTAATAIAVLGALIWLTGIPLAWPNPVRMMIIAAAGYLLFSAIALRFSLAPAHLLSGASLALAVLLGVHCWPGQLAWQEADPARVARAIISYNSGLALIPVGLLLALSSAVAIRWKRSADAHYQALAATALSSLSLVLVVAHAWRNETLTSLAMPLLGISAVWLSVSWLLRWPHLFTAFQALLSAAVVVAASARLEHETWFQAAARPWLDPWTLQTQAIALAVLALIWAVLRIAARRWGLTAPFLSKLHGLLNPPWPAPDRVINVLLLMTLIGLALYGAVPGIAQELTPRTLARQLIAEPDNTALRVVPPLAAFQLPGVPHDHALGYGTWLLGGLLLFVFLAGQWEHYNPWRIFAVVVVLAMACPMIAAWWTPEVAAASAMRWIAAGFLLLGSVVIWCREPLARFTGRLHWPGWGQQPAALSRDCRMLLLSVVVLFLAAMGAYVALAAVMPGPIDPGVSATVPWLAVTFSILSVAALSLRLTPTSLFSNDSMHAVWQTWSRQVSLLLLILGAAPLIAVSLFVVTMALRGNPVAGPEPFSIFSRMGLAVSYAVPILLIALSLVGHALRERSAPFAFAAGLLFNTAATAGYLLALGTSQLDAALWIRLAQLNALVAAVYGLAWWMLHRYAARHVATDAGFSLAAPPPLLVTQAILPLAFIALILTRAGVSLWWHAKPLAEHLTAGDGLGWLSFAVAAVAGALVLRGTAPRVGPGATWACLAAIATLTALTAARWDTGNWLAFHVLSLGHVVAVGLLTFRFAIGTPSGVSTAGVRRSVARWVVLAAMVAGWLALRGAFDEPQRPWWTLAALCALAAILAASAAWAWRQRLLYLAGLALNLSASVWWIERMWPAGPRRFIIGAIELVEINALILALPVIAWALIELRIIRPALADTERRARLPLHATAAILSMLLLGGMVVLGLLGDLFGEHLELRAWLGWTALAASAVAIMACLWDASLRMPVFGLYLLGLVAAGMTVDQFNLQPARWLGWMGTMVLAAYALGTSYLWSRREGLRQFADAAGVPRGAENSFASLRWLIPANGLLILAVLAAAFWVDLVFPEQGLRLLTGKAALFQTLSMGLLARGQRRSMLQTATLVVGVVASVAWSWAWLDPETTGTLLNRGVAATAALAAVVVVYGLGLAKLLPTDSEWIPAARRLVPALIVMTALSLALVLATELVLWLTQRAVIMAPWAILVVAVALLGLAVAALAAAVLPGRDPLGLSERGRTAYVYAAEVLVALLVVHIRLTMPWLFHGFFSRYWTFVVVLIAFVGVGLSEFFARRRQSVLSEPLERTGAFLPLLPVLGFWVAPAGHYSLVLFSVGAVYATLAVMRKSFGFGVLAAIAANGGLWFFLHRLDGFGLLDHPQMWCIPPAVCILAAAWLNRDRLSAEQMTGIRYLTSMTIYVSSTADIFLNGVAEAPWLPLVLAGISLLGIFAGIFLRVRAFLFLGTSFLVLSLLTIIWHAAHDLQQTWVWAASGIVAGVLILALFALFEKKRQEVLRLVDQLKEWD